MKLKDYLEVTHPAHSCSNCIHIFENKYCRKILESFGKVENRRMKKVEINNPENFECSYWEKA